MEAEVEGAYCTTTVAEPILLVAAFPHCQYQSLAHQDIRYLRQCSLIHPELAPL